MKVICIDTPEEHPNSTVTTDGPIEGDIDTVIDDGWDCDLEEYYCLERYGYRIGFSKKHFIPLSSIDETETEAYKNLQTQTI